MKQTRPRQFERQPRTIVPSPIPSRDDLSDNRNFLFTKKKKQKEREERNEIFTKRTWRDEKHDTEEQGPRCHIRDPSDIPATPSKPMPFPIDSFLLFSCVDRSCDGEP